MELNLEIDRSSLIPLYAQLAQSIKSAILSGALSYGEKLPSENEFMAQSGLGRVTIRSALAQLASEKYIEKRQGRGVYVTYTHAAPTDSRSIDVLLDISDMHFSYLYIKSIAEVLTQNNYQLVIHDTLNSQQEICVILTRILQKGSCGIIIHPSSLQEPLLPEQRDLLTRLDANGIPYITFDRTYENLPGTQLSFDDFGGGRMAAEYLISLGHRNYAMVCNSAFCENQLRMDGFNSVLAENGLPPLHIIEGDANLEENLFRLIQTEHVTAIYNFNDENALKTIRALHHAGLQVPNDVSVIGFDDTVIATAITPQLTSIVHPKGTLGHMAAAKLLAMVEKRPVELDLDILKPQIHIRASCAPPRQA